jgi:hypothetical protein
MKHFISLEPVESDPFAESEIIRTRSGVRSEYAGRGAKEKRAYNKWLPLPLKGIINFPPFKPATFDLVKGNNIPFFYLPFYFPGPYSRSDARKRNYLTFEQHLISENKKTGTKSVYNFIQDFVAVFSSPMMFLVTILRYLIIQMSKYLRKFFNLAWMMPSERNRKMLKRIVF